MSPEKNPATYVTTNCSYQTSVIHCLNFVHFIFADDVIIDGVKSVHNLDRYEWCWRGVHHNVETVHVAKLQEKCSWRSPNIHRFPCSYDTVYVYWKVERTMSTDLHSCTMIHFRKDRFTPAEFIADDPKIQWIISTFHWDNNSFMCKYVFVNFSQDILWKHSAEEFFWSFFLGQKHSHFVFRCNSECF